MTAKANQLFEIGDYVGAAAEFARTLVCFEEIALKFVNMKEREPLRTFLEARLNNGERHPSRLAVLTLWITELYLEQLGEFRDAGQEQSKDFDQLQEAFHKFLGLQEVRILLPKLKNTLYELLSSHGDVNNMVYLACITEDHNRTIEHYIRAEEWRTALTKLMQQPEKELHYRYGPTLIRHLPGDTIDCWSALGKKLQPCRLLPALLQAEPKYALSYLERVTGELHAIDRPLHNYLLTLYAKHYHKKLLPYLETQGNDVDRVSIRHNCNNILETFHCNNLELQKD